MWYTFTTTKTDEDGDEFVVLSEGHDNNCYTANNIDARIAKKKKEIKKEQKRHEQLTKFLATYKIPRSKKLFKAEFYDALLSLHKEFLEWDEFVTFDTRVKEFYNAISKDRDFEMLDMVVHEHLKNTA